MPETIRACPLASLLGLPQHPDQHRPERPVLLAIDQEFGKGATLRVAPELSDRVGPLEVEQHEDVEQLGAGSGTKPAAKRVGLDPYDPATSRHAGQCEFKDTTDRDVLKVKPGLDEGYKWVTCGSCSTSGRWRIAEESVG
jgi:hypothetical protein